MRKVPASLLTATGLIGGFTAARKTKHRHWSGVVAGAGGLAAMEACRRNTGLGTACALGCLYAAALGASHPLARKIGAWPSVLTVTTATSTAAHLLSDQRRASK